MKVSLLELGISVEILARSTLQFYSSLILLSILIGKMEFPYEYLDLE